MHINLVMTAWLLMLGVVVCFCNNVTLCQDMHPSKVITLIYSFFYMLVLFGLFFAGPNLWPNKRARMMYGYLVYLCALVVPALVSLSMLARQETPISMACAVQHEPAVGPTAVVCLVICGRSMGYD